MMELDTRPRFHEPHSLEKRATNNQPRLTTILDEIHQPLNDLLRFSQNLLNDSDGSDHQRTQAALLLDAAEMLHAQLFDGSKSVATGIWESKNARKVLATNDLGDNTERDDALFLKHKIFGAVATKGASGDEDIFVRENGRLVRVSLDDILFFENIGDYVRIKTRTGQHIIHATLKGIDEKLADPRFQKVHRTYIVNLSKIKDVEEGSLTIERTTIPISRAQRAELMSRLNIL